MRPRRAARLALQIGAVAAVGLGLFVLERRRPARAGTVGLSRRFARSAVVGASGAVAFAAAVGPTVTVAARAGRRIGLLPRLRLPPVVEAALGVLALDYALYVWHVLLHRVPTLWRFHAVHHLDRDLDTLTAARFHAGEMILSAPFHAAVVAALGVPARALRLYAALFPISVLFHHSALLVPRRIERALARVVTTPRLHAIHHAEDPALRDANWSSGLVVWDVLHGTRVEHPGPRPVVIGLPSRPGDAGAFALLALPFRARAAVLDARAGAGPVDGEGDAGARHA